MVAKKLVKRKLSDPPREFGKIPSFLFVFTSIFLVFAGYRVDLTLKEIEYNEYYEMANSIGNVLRNELRNEGHATLNQSNEIKSNVYSHILEKMSEWQNNLPEVQSVYTLKMKDNGDIYFVVAPATDYNRDGRISGQLERLVPIGTQYNEVVPQIKKAFDGKFVMQKTPTFDQWGYSIRAFTPIFDREGKVDAVLGIDFDGNQFERKMNESWKVITLIGLIFLVNILIYILALLSKAESFLSKKHQNELNRMAYFDELTGLPNRNYLKRLIQLDEWGEERVGILLFGFEGLDAIDDLLGHSKCDNVYMASIKRIQASLHENMMLVRWSEREHLVIIKGYSLEKDVLCFAETTVKQFSTSIHIGSKDFYISPKFGISFYPKDGTDWNTLVKNADIARSHINFENDKRVLVYNRSLLPEFHEKRDIELELHHAVLTEQFEVYYQPQISLTTGKIIGMEALVRWNHPTKGIISPLKFIPLAEELHLINPIGLWVLRKACIQTMQLNQSFGLSLRVSVNLSSVQLQHPNLLQNIKDILQETEFDPKQLDLEITEGSLFNFEKSTQVLEDIKQLGIHISLDDFGAGYSSLSYLKKLKIHRLKIDRIFLSNIPNEEDTLMSSIVTLGHNLNLRVLAEGAETEEQVNFLKTIQCDEVQGYFFAKPLPFEVFMEYLRTGHVS